MSRVQQDESLRLVTLHTHPEHMEHCMNMLNDQWPRSKTMRMRSLGSSCDEFPTSLVFLRNTPQGTTEVIGHARINILPQDRGSAWVESVIIRQDLRGEGYGRLLMTRTEEYVRACGFSTVYLSTHDQQVFYGKLGYQFCAPVCIYGGAVNKNLIPKQFIVPEVSNNEKTCVNNFKAAKNFGGLTTNCVAAETKSISSITNSPATGPPPPPPPPPPPKITKEHIKKLDVSAMSKMYMKKDLL